MNGYKEAPWGIAQACDETLPSENNELLKHEIDKGSTVYNVRLDSASMDGVDVKDAEKPGTPAYLLRRWKTWLIFWMALILRPILS